MNIYQLHYFRTMARVEHYTKAAQMLCITQPSLSNAISALEDDLGTQLFEKQGRNVVLSKNGKLFLTYVENALNEIKAGTDKIKELSNDYSAPINIGFVYTLSSHFIPSLIGGFRGNKEFSEVSFSLHEGCTTHECTPTLIRELKNDNLDLIFIARIPKDSDLQFIPICSQPMVAIVPYDSPLACQDSVDLKNLGAYPLIQFASRLKEEVIQMFEQVNVIPNGSCEVEGESSIAGMVAANMGISIVPDSPIFRNYRVKILPISNPVHERTIYLGFMKNRPMSLATQQFKNYVVKNANTISQVNLAASLRAPEPEAPRPAVRLKRATSQRTRLIPMEA